MASEAGKAAAPWPPVVVWAIRLAIVALSLYNLYNFLEFRNWLPQKLADGFPMTQIIWGNIFTLVINPLSALAAIVLAVMGKWLALAVPLAAMTQLHFLGSMALFIIAVMIYGF